MASKKGGLGKVDVNAAVGKEDLLASVFGDTKEEKTDTPRPAKAGKQKTTNQGKSERVGKYFLLNRELAKAMKLFAVEHEMKEIEVIEASLRAFLKKSST